MGVRVWCMLAAGCCNVSFVARLLVQHVLRRCLRTKAAGKEQALELRHHSDRNRAGSSRVEAPRPLRALEQVSGLRFAVRSNTSRVRNVLKDTGNRLLRERAGLATGQHGELESVGHSCLLLVCSDILARDIENLTPITQLNPYNNRYCNLPSVIRPTLLCGVSAGPSALASPPKATCAPTRARRATGSFST